MTEPILAATAWKSNAELIADCFELGYLRDEWLTLDPTFGRGIWWKKMWPSELVTHDIALDGVDFRHLPESSSTFDAIAFDPPYVCVGGRDTTTIPDMHARYGLTDAPKTPQALQGVINCGLREMNRVLKSNGMCLVKCQSYVSSGKLWLGAHHTLTHAIRVGFEVVDILQHISGVRPQPSGRRQCHSRNNYSTLYVFRKP